MLMMHHAFCHLGMTVMTTTLARITIEVFGALPADINMMEPIGKQVTVR